MPGTWKHNALAGWLGAIGVLAGCSAGPSERLLAVLREEDVIAQRDLAMRGSEFVPRALGAAPTGGDALPQHGSITLPTLLSIADRRSQRLVAARARLGMSGAEAWQSTLRPNPSIEVESENISSRGGLGESETTVRWVQPIIMSDRREAASASGRARLEVRRLEIDQLRRRIHGHIRREFATITALRESLSLHEQLTHLSRQTLEIAETRFEARAAPESEAIRARVELNQLTLNAQRIEGELAASAARLEALLGGVNIDVERIDADSVHEPASPYIDVEEIKRVVRSAHPAVLAALAEIDAAEREVHLHRELATPDITGRIGVGLDHGADDEFIEAAVAVPLTIFDRNQGNVLAARFNVIRARAEARAVKTELIGEAVDAFERWRAADGQLAVFDAQILHEAQRAYEQAALGYRAGRLAFLDLLDAQRTVAEAQLSKLEITRSAGIALAELHALMGDDMTDSPSSSSHLEVSEP